MSEKQPMQADGRGTERHVADENGEVASRRALRGESDGGPYPNPHSDKDEESKGFHGGQSDQAYYGGSQLGERRLAEQPNAPSTEE